MKTNRKVQLSMLIGNTQSDVIREVRNIFEFHFDPQSFSFIENAFDTTVTVFEGRFHGYRACNMEYHDLGHTLDTFLAAARLVDGSILKGKTVSQQKFENILLAALVHDTGYIQEEGDNSGTGAKYTKSHVDRSVSFLKKNKAAFTIDEARSDDIASLVLCTGLSASLYLNQLDNDDDSRAGAIIGTADLIGQMSDRTYLEKLLFLYFEFREAGIEGFNTEFDILRKTLDFYQITMNKLDKDFFQVYKLAQTHFGERYGIERNLYMQAIENQMNYLKEIIEDETTNFRKKLKRLDLEKIVHKVG